MKLLLLAALFLSGCQTYSQLTPEKQALKLDEFKAQCTSFGYKAGTEAYAQCIQASVINFDQTVTSQNNARRERVAAAGRGLQQAGNNISNSSRANRPLNCTSRKVGSTVQTNCY